MATSLGASTAKVSASEARFRELKGSLGPQRCARGPGWNAASAATIQFDHTYFWPVSLGLSREQLPRFETNNCKRRPDLSIVAPGPVGCENAWDRYATSKQHAGPEKGDCG